MNDIIPTTYQHKRGEWLYEDARLLRAWTDILKIAEPKDRKVRKNGKQKDLKAGVAYVSKRELGRRWGWGRDTVSDFLDRLVDDGFIILECKERGKTEIRIVDKMDPTPTAFERVNPSLSSFIMRSDFQPLREPDIDIVTERPVLSASLKTSSKTSLKTRLESSLASDDVQGQFEDQIQDQIQDQFEDQFDAKKGNLKEGLDSLTDKAIDTTTDSLQGEKRGVGEEEASDRPKLQEAPRFKKPTIEEVRAYCEERQNGIDPEHFWYYYESKGWTVGRSGKMKDFRAAIRTWEKNNKYGFDKITGADKKAAMATQAGKMARSFKNFQERDTDYDELFRLMGG